MNTCYSSRSHRLARFFSFGLLDGLHGIAVSRKAGSRRHGPLTISRPPYSARRGPPRRAQTWRALFIAPCALREAHGKWWAGARTSLGLSRFATIFVE